MSMFTAIYRWMFLVTFLGMYNNTKGKKVVEAIASAIIASAWFIVLPALIVRGIRKAAIRKQ